MRAQAAAAGAHWLDASSDEAHGRTVVTLAGAPAGAVVRGDAWHPLGRAPDHDLRFAPVPAGFRSAEPLPAGRWRIRIEVQAAGKHWRTEEMVG